MRRFRLLLSAALFLVPVAAHAECDGSADCPVARLATSVEESQSSAAYVKGLIADVKDSGQLSFAGADQILHGAIKGGLTTAALRPAWKFFASLPAGVTADSKTIDGASITADAGAHANAQEMFWGLPRDLKAPKGAGQTFTEFSKLDSTMYFLSDRPAQAFRLRVKGTSAKAYTLRFKIAATKIEIAIPKDTSPSDAATLIANAINAKSDAIVNGAGNATSWASGDDSYLTGVAATTSGAAVWIAPAVDS